MWALANWPTVGRFCAGHGDMGAGIADVLSAEPDFHGKVLVGQSAEAGGVVVDEEAIGAIGDPGISKAGSTVVVTVVKVSEAELGVGYIVVLGHHSNRNNGKQREENGLFHSIVSY